MPTYEYACRECGEHLEVVQKFTDDALTQCPACDGSLRKVFGTIGIAFKGSGFYKNDSRTNGNGNGDGKDRDKDRDTDKAKDKDKDKAKEPAKAESSSSGSDTKKADTPPKADSTKKNTSTAAAS